MTLEQFLIEFKLRQNKAVAAGTVLSDSVLGYTLLQCANLPPDKIEMVRATCTDLTFNSVKAQLGKIGLGNSLSNKILSSMVELQNLSCLLCQSRLKIPSMVSIDMNLQMMKLRLFIPDRTTASLLKLITQDSSTQTIQESIKEIRSIDMATTLHADFAHALTTCFLIACMHLTMSNKSGHQKDPVDQATNQATLVIPPRNLCD